jgi:hypothetical protein
MNRRQMMIAAGATLAATLSMPVWARPAANTIARWEPGTQDSPHALLAAGWIMEQRRAGLIYTTGESFGFGHKFTLTDPSFVVRLTDILWHPTRGYQYKPSLEIDVYERGVFIGTSQMASNADYVDYWRSPLPADHPDFWFRPPHTPYEKRDLGPVRVRDVAWEVVEERPGKRYATIPELEAKLGRDAIGFDDRWMKHFRAKA